MRAVTSTSTLLHGCKSPLKGIIRTTTYEQQSHHVSPSTSFFQSFSLRHTGHGVNEERNTDGQRGA